jgi:hypothetical protein
MGVETWWNDHWISRSVVQTTTGSPHSSGTHFLRVDADLDSLVSEGKLRSDYADLRVICQKAGHNINVPYYIATNATPKRVFFAAQHDIPADTNIGSAAQTERYYFYFENPTTYNTHEPDDYVNINFPKAPYSVHPDGYATAYGTYRDKHLLRLNDDPSAGPEMFEDATGHSSGVSRHFEKVQKGHSGVLDQSTYFDGDFSTYASPPSGTWIELPQNDHYNWGTPSGDWAVDFWLRVAPNSTYHYGTVLHHSVGHTIEYDEEYPRIWYYFSTAANYARMYSRCNFSSRDHLYNLVRPGRYVPSGSWNHFRIAYRTGGDYYSRMYIWCNGSGVGNYDHTVSTDSTAIAENTCFFGQDQVASVYIGYNYRNETSDQYMLTGWLEQVRYSTFVYPGISGIAVDGDEYHCAPAWVEEQYIGTLGPSTLQQSASGSVGGVVLSESVEQASGVWGGAMLGRQGNTVHIGGILHSITDERATYFGGYLLSRVETSGAIGGFAICSRGDIEIHSIEGLNRVLIKSSVEPHEDQRFAADAGFAFYGTHTGHFDSKLQVQRGFTDEFDAKLRVFQTRRNPYVEITDIQHSYSGFMPATCTITASGHAYDYNNVQLESGIHYVSIIWGDNDFTTITTPVESGSVWSATHTYTHSGLYQPIVFVRDKYGRSGADYDELNLASGIDVPYISLSGSPREGTTPPPLSVDLGIEVSGTLGAYTVYWDLGNGISYFNNAVTQVAQYPMPGDYIPWVRIEDQRGIYVTDTLRVGYNR